MKKKLKITAVAAAVLVLLLAPSVLKGSIRWAKALETEDIAKLELVVMPSAENERYRLFEPEEYAEPVKLINGSRGIYTLFPIPKSGNAHALYVTTTDGTRHCVVNSYSGYLTIDGDTYYYPHFERVWDWIKDHELDLGNSVMPEGFEY